MKLIDIVKKIILNYSENINIDAFNELKNYIKNNTYNSIEFLIKYNSLVKYIGTNGYKADNFVRGIINDMINILKNNQK